MHIYFGICALFSAVSLAIASVRQRNGGTTHRKTGSVAAGYFVQKVFVARWRQEILAGDEIVERSAKIYVAHQCL